MEQNRERVSSLSVVVPAYNSEALLELLTERLGAVLPALAHRFELVIVNDGSSDGTWSRILELSKALPWLRGVNLMRNYGQHNALLCGVRAATGEVIITMDDDLQHPPEEIPKLLDKLAQGYDVVYGTPQREQHGLWRDVASRITKLALQSVMGAQTARNASAFRAFRARIREAFDDYKSPYVSIDVLLSWGTTGFSAVSVEHHPRPEGVSNYTLRKLVVHALNMMTGFSIWPLQAASLIGFAFTLFGVGVLLYVLVRYFILGGSVPGFPFLASIIAIFSGAQLFATGIIGEYLARMHQRVMAQPVYNIRSLAVDGAEVASTEKNPSFLELEQGQ